MSSNDSAGPPSSPAAEQPESTPASRLSPRAQAVLRGAKVGAGFALGALVSATLVAAATITFVMLPNLPDIGSLTDYRPKLPMRIFSSDGVLLGEFGEERRHFTPIAQIPKVMQDAVIAVEDASFREHHGVDFKGVLRAGVAGIVHPKSEGASTITMQVARNFYLPTKKDYVRKMYEMLLAFKIERELSKEQILEVYMNQIYLGQRAYGFAAASEMYLGKPLSEVTVGDAAMLAGLPQSPNKANPITNRKSAITRQRHVLQRMRVLGFITDEQVTQAVDHPPPLRRAREVPVHAEYVAETARQLIYEQYGEAAYSRGLDVTLTVDAAQQMAAYRALRRGIMDFERRQPYRGPEAQIELPADDAEQDARIAEVLAEHPDNDELKSAVVLSVEPRQVEAQLDDGETVSITGDGLRQVAQAVSGRGAQRLRIRPGSVVRLIKGPKGDWAITHLPEVEGAFVAMTPDTGAIRALVGGFDHSKNQFNHVTQAWRQPGSSIKPFIYSAALEKGMTPSTIINDAPLAWDAESNGGTAWEPKNSDGKFDGPMTMRNALAASKNMVSIRILQTMGTPFAQEWLTHFGFDAEKHPPYLTMALGAGSATPMQVASAYSVIANGGYRLDPFLIRSITDGRGKKIAEWQPPPVDESMRAIDARNAFIMTDLLQEVTRTGTAARAQATLKRPDIAGKTGTTNDAVDAWFAGFQRSVVAVVWMGYDSPRKLGDRESGGGLSLPVWLDFMGTALKNVPVHESQAPDGVVRLKGEWYYEENTPASGISTIGLDAPPAAAPTESDRKSILDLFK